MKQEHVQSLRWIISRIRQHSGLSTDKLRLENAIKIGSQSQKNSEKERFDLASRVFKAAGFETVKKIEEIERECLPVVVWSESSINGFSLIVGKNAQGQLIEELEKGGHAPYDLPRNSIVIQAKINNSDGGYRTAFDHFIRAFKSYKLQLIEGVLASIVINFLALITSLYSMQIYDRVVPTKGYSTLITLTVAVVFALFIDLAIKAARSHLLDYAAKGLDAKVAKVVYKRLLSIRLDQRPAVMGTFTAQVRGYETVRAFFSAATLYLLVDIPFATVYITCIAFIGGVQLALIPAVFLFVSVAYGLLLKRRVARHATSGLDVSNRKVGLLVESIEGAESIKASGSHWRFESKWLALTDKSIEHELTVRRLNEHGVNFASFCQQASYIGLVALGAYQTANGSITMGGLIACSILSGRVLQPIAMFPNILVQWAHARASLQGLEKIFALETDNHGVDRPIILNKINGDIRIEDVIFGYQGANPSLRVPSLVVGAGEKVGIIGPVGAGKSSLLKIASGLYKPKQGRVLIDDIDVAQIDRGCLSEAIGYIPQDVKLFSGTLRENLTLGLLPITDDEIWSVLNKIGLNNWVSKHPKGLDMEIGEGGTGLSGGQRQLVALTRLVLSKPSVWLLDEPTASLDELSEAGCLNLLREKVKKEATLLLVTHKMSLLNLVDRILVVTPEGIVLDGPRDKVLAELSRAFAAKSGPQPQVIKAVH